MGHSRTERRIPLEDLVISKAQARVSDVGKEIDELAESIRVQGLLQPIIVCPAATPGKFEILAGQRRFLAHKHLGWSEIQAIVLERVDETTAKVISATENLMRRDLSQKEKVDVCTALFHKYGTLKAVVEATGLPQREVSHYVKYPRLAPELKQLVDKGEVDIKAALRTQDAVDLAGGEEAPAEVVKLAKEMSTMSGVQQKKLIKERQESPDTPLEEVIESAKSGAKVVQIVVTLSAEVHRSLQAFAKSENANQDEAAATLIEEGLLGKGFAL